MIVGRGDATWSSAAFFAVVSGAFWSAHLDIARRCWSRASRCMSLSIGLHRDRRRYGWCSSRRIDFTQPVLDDPAIPGDAAAVRGALVSRGVARLLAAGAAWPSWSRSSWRFAGVDFWERASGYLLANLRGRASRWRLAPRCCFTSAHAVAAAGSATWMDTFLTSHSIARARATIDEIDEFARD